MFSRIIFSIFLSHKNIFWRHTIFLCKIFPVFKYLYTFSVNKPDRRFIHFLWNMKIELEMTYGKSLKKKSLSFKYFVSSSIHIFGNNHNKFLWTQEHVFNIRNFEIPFSFWKNIFKLHNSNVHKILLHVYLFRYIIIRFRRTAFFLSIVKD